MNLTPEGEKKAREDYDEAWERIYQATKTCPQCKASRTRALKKDPEAKVGDTFCKKHREQFRLAYVTSPISETYWAS